MSSTKATLYWSFSINLILFHQRDNKPTEYCKRKPAKSSLGIFNAPRRSSRVNVIPIPSMVMVRPIMVKSGVTQLKAPGFTSPSKHPSETHTGNAVDTASPTNSTHSPKLLPFSVGKSPLDDETPPHRVKSSTLLRCLHVREGATRRRDSRDISRLVEQEIRRRCTWASLNFRKEFAFNCGVVVPFERERETTEEAIFLRRRFSNRSNEEEEEDTRTCTHVPSRDLSTF